MLCFLVVPAVSNARAVPSSTQPSPNILIIVTDDQARGSMGVMPDTAHLFGDQGTKFMRMFVTTPLCCPSRASILTGRYAHNHGVHDNNQGVENVLDQSTTLERYLHDAGYRTGIYGKFLNGWPLNQDPPNFDRWAVFPRSLEDAYRGGQWDVQGQVRTVRSYVTDFIRSEAKSFITEGEGNDAQPWFLYLATPNPHVPAITKPRFRDAPVPPMRITPSMRERDRSDKPPFIRASTEDPETMANLRTRMLRSLMPVDNMVNGVFDLLRSDGELRNTLAFFLSDNGFLYGEHGWVAKSVPYTESIGSVMFARWPNHFAAGARDARLVAGLDIAPTVMQAAGLTPKPGVPMDGRSLLDPGERGHLLTEFWAFAGYPVPTWASFRSRRRQYVEYYNDKGHVAFREYYDLKADSYQLHNLLGDGNPANDPPDVASLSARVASDRTCEGVTCP